MPAMNWRQVSVACLFATTTFWNLAATAQTEDVRAQIANAEREQSTLSQQIAAKQKQIDTLRSRPSPEQKELADARRTVEEARATFKTAATPDNESKLKNAEFKYTLAERKYDKSNGDVAALVAEVESLKSQVAGKQRQVKTLQQQATEQAAAPKAPVVDPKQQQKLADDRAKQKLQEQELEKTKQQNDAAQKEIERLKSLLANKETANAPAVVAAPATKPAAPVVAAPVAAAAVTPSTVSSATADAGGLRQLSSKTDVVAELQMTAQRAGNDNTRGKTPNEIVYFKLLQNGKEVGKERAALRALGNAQFRGTAKLNAGSYDVVLGQTHWKAEVAGINGETEFVILLDESDANKPKLSFYNQALEGK
jgi:cell division protein FtsB